MNLQQAILTLLLLLPSFVCNGMNQIKNFYVQNKTKFQTKTNDEIKHLLLENLMVCTYYSDMVGNTYLINPTTPYSGEIRYKYPIKPSKILAIVKKKQQSTQNNQRIQAGPQIQNNQRSQHKYFYKKGKKSHKRGPRYTKKQGHQSTRSQINNNAS